MISLGFNLYLCCLILCLFDTAQPAINALSLTKRGAALYCVAVLICSLLEDIFIFESFSISIAGFLLPLLLCCKVAINLSSRQAGQTLAFAMISSAGCWAIMQIFMQSTELINIDLSWIRGLAAVIFTLMFTHNHSSAVITAYLCFFLSGYWTHMDMIISGQLNYWAAGSGEELAVTAFMLMALMLVCQGFSIVGQRRKAGQARLSKQRV